MNENKPEISNTVAREQFDSLLDYYDIDLDDYEDEKDSVGKVIEGLAKKLTRAIKKGYLVVELREGRMFVVQHLRCEIKGEGSRLEYKPVNGRSRTAMNGIPPENNFEKLFAIAASLTGIEKGKIQNIEGADLGLLENLCSLFRLV